MAIFSLKWSVMAVFLLSVCAIVPVASAQPADCATPVVKAKKGDRVPEWFQKYDQIRRKAQMSPDEKERSGKLLTQGIAASVFKTADSAQDAKAASDLLRKMVDRYTKASAEMAALPQVGDTKKLHQGYSQYFKDAGGIFGDYLKIQGNLFATDGNGNSILGQLQQRKAALEALDVTNKELDSKLRDKYGIAPFAY